MGELERIFGPTYQPSAGSVYPALSALEAEELIVPTGDEVPKRYEATIIGLQSLEDRRGKVAEIERRTGAFLRTQDAVESELSQLVQAVRAASGRVDPDEITEVLRGADRQVRDLMDGGRTT